MKQRATAIAIATLMVAAGLSIAQPVTAEHKDCHKTFDVAESESNAMVRDLPQGELDVGRADTDAGQDRILNVELVQGDELTWQVFEKNSLGNCVEYTDGGCDGPTVISSPSTDTCTLEANPNTAKDYWVHIEATGTSDIDYQVFES